MSQENTSVTVAAKIRERISDGVLTPGSRLPAQAALAAEFGVNRTVVRHALDTLKAEGLLLSTGRGARATVTMPAQRPARPHSPAPASTLLVERLRAALTADRVTLDVFSMTAETLSNAFAAVLPEVLNGSLRPGAVHVRLLVPSPAAHLAFPRSVSGPGGEAEDPALERMHEKVERWTATLRDQVRGLGDQQLVDDVAFEARTVKITPVHKLYLLNGRESLIGYYRLLEHSVRIRDEALDIYDSLGAQTKLFRSSNGPDRRDEQDAAFVDESLVWFESLWSTLGEPYTLG